MVGVRETGGAGGDAGCGALWGYDLGLHWMLSPPRMMVPLTGRYATPMRGPKLLVSVFSRPLGKTPLKSPVAPATTGATAVNPGAASRLTMCPSASVYGITNS